MIDAIPAQVIRSVLRLFPAIRPHLSEAALKIATEYRGIRAEMSGAIHDAVYDYLSGTGNVTSYRSAMALAVSQAYIETADVSYVEGGGELPLDDETAAWARSALDQQLAYIDQLFETLKELRKQGDVNVAAEALARANGYAGSLDAFAAEAQMRGSKNITLEFGGDDGKESCPECKGMKGRRHKISYILAHDLVPRPGNSAYSCNGYNCEHYWFNPKTGEKYAL